MKRYEVAPLRAPLPELTGRVFDPASEPFCRAHPGVPIDSYVWQEDYNPEARAWMAWDAEGLSVLLCAEEAKISVKADAFNGPVYQDSCLECFLQPFEDDPRYFNFEVNAGGVALIGFGEQRQGRIRLPRLPEGMDIRASKHAGGWWAVAYVIPYELIAEWFGGRKPLPGGRMRGNFYKCDESIHPHFGSWNPVVSPKPDFHRPECFGLMELAPVAEA